MKYIQKLYLLAVILTGIFLTACQEDDILELADKNFGELAVAQESCTDGLGLVLEKTFDGWDPGTEVQVLEEDECIIIGNEGYCSSDAKNDDGWPATPPTKVKWMGESWDFRLDYNGAGSGEIMALECKKEVIIDPPIPGVNKISDLLAALLASGCDTLELESNTSTPNGQASMGTMVSVSAQDIDVKGIHTFNVNEADGEDAFVIFSGTSYQIPLVGATEGQQIRLRCRATSPPQPGLTNEMPALLQALDAAQNCVENGVELENALSAIGWVASVGQKVELSETGIDLSGVITLLIDTLNGTPKTIIFDGQPYEVPLTSAPSQQQIRLKCSEADPIVNEIQGLLDAIGQTPDCDTLELDSDLWANGISIPEGTWVVISPTDINFVGYFIYDIDEMEGEETTVEFNGQSFILPIGEGDGNTIRLRCRVTAPPVTNQVQELINDFSANPNCSLKFLEVGVSTPNGFAPAGTELEVTTTAINIIGFYTYSISGTNSDLVQFVFNGQVYLIPIVGGPSGQVRIECETPVTVDDQQLHFPYRNLLYALGWDGTALPLSGKWNLNNSCSELRYQILSEGIDLQMEPVVDVDGSGNVIKYGFRIIDGNTITNHWFDTNGQTINLVYNGAFHTTKYSPPAPGYILGGTRQVQVICQP